MTSLNARVAWVVALATQKNRGHRRRHCGRRRSQPELTLKRATMKDASSVHVRRYYAIASDAGCVTAFHSAFSLFRLAVIFAGIAARAQSGSANADNAAAVGKLSAAFARHAVEAI